MSAALRLAKAMIPGRVWESRTFQITTHLLRSHNAIYSQGYYAQDVEDAAAKSAAAMAGVIFDRFHPCAVIDVGCGTGALLEAFRNLGCDVRGREYSDAGLAYCRRRDLLVEKFNIEKDCIANGEQYDLAVSFEVAEHLPSWSADRYVELLCGLAPLVVMSAATPGQGGHGHINEQSHAYWIEKFRERSYPMDEIASRHLSSQWNASGVASWYCDNVMVFKRR